MFWSRGFEPPCTSHSLNKVTLGCSPFKITYLVIFVACFLFLLLTAELSFCLCKRQYVYGRRGLQRQCGYLLNGGMGNLFSLVTAWLQE